MNESPSGFVKRFFFCERCENICIVSSPGGINNPDDERRCPDAGAPGGYWYCTYTELVRLAVVAEKGKT